MPFATTVLFIVGMCSLGLPGLSGFVAEMTVFIGSWERTGLFYRIATLAACISIVVTAVYILRAISRTAMGPLKEQFKNIGDVSWNEKLAAYLLLAAILVMGIIPTWVVDLVKPGAEMIINRISGK